MSEGTEEGAAMMSGEESLRGFLVAQVQQFVARGEVPSAISSTFLVLVLS